MYRQNRAIMGSETPLSDVRFLTVAQVALAMRVSKMTVYRLVHSGELEAIRVGRSFRIPEEAVRAYLGISLKLLEQRALAPVPMRHPQVVQLALRRAQGLMTMMTKK